ncbi:MAG TPA: hypothetical protein VE196_08655 [Pseudonocardiaceae bacterium]|nr:hypothetical protein [Pseudonocardiaceae bacterium]
MIRLPLVATSGAPGSGMAGSTVRAPLELRRAFQRPEVLHVRLSGELSPAVLFPRYGSASFAKGIRPILALL